MTPLRRISLFIAAAVSACAQTSEPGHFKSEQTLDPSYVVGKPSTVWDVPPRLISGEAPIYPIGELFKGEQGAAEIAFTINVDGTTSDFEVLTTDNKYFASHGIYAIKQWKFHPAEKDGQKIAIKIKQRFVFKPT